MHVGEGLHNRGMDGSKVAAALQSAQYGWRLMKAGTLEPFE